VEKKKKELEQNCAGKDRRDNWFCGFSVVPVGGLTAPIEATSEPPKAEGQTHEQQTG
jgi:hypothetical protein